MDDWKGFYSCKDASGNPEILRRVLQGLLGLKHCSYFQGRIERTVVCRTEGSRIAEELLGFLK